MAEEDGAGGYPKSPKERFFEEDLPSQLRPPVNSSLRSQKRPLKVGFECEFIDKPKELQTECPICLHILRDPYQATCCGYIYCHSCIERVREASKPCPACNSTEFSIFPDKRLHKSLYSFKVWCNHKSNGCNWSGELRDISNHLNQEPSYERRLVGCDFMSIECSQCGEFIQRASLKNHETTLCQYRDYTCEHCKKVSGKYKNIIENHQPECPLQLLPCPNKCGEKIERQNLEDHVKTECKLRPPDKMACEFSFAGCTEMVTPDEMEKHLKEGVHDHLNLVATSHLSLRERLIELQRHFDESNRSEKHCCCS